LHGCAKCRKTKEEHPALGCETWRPVPKFADLAANIHRGFQNADFAGYNHRTFDMKVLVVELGRCGYKLDLTDAKMIDAYRLWMQLEKRKLADFVRRYGKRELENAHDAMADVFGTEDGLVGCLEEHTTLPRTVPELHDFIYPPDPTAIDPEGKFIFVEGVPYFNFGKHRGTPVAKNLGYLQWMIKSEFAPEVKAVCEILAKNKGLYPTTLPLEPASVESPSDST
jgi:DNA polymerase-3 subunit epsilon